MRTLIEGGGFAALAIGVHLFFVGLTPPESGSSSAGENGEFMTSMEASSESMEAIVAQWDTPPDADVEVTELVELSPPVLDAPPPMLQITPPTLSTALAPSLLESAHVNNEVSLPPQTPPELVVKPEPDPKVEALQKTAPVPRPKVPPKPKRAPVKPSKPAAKAAPKASVASVASAAQKAAGSGGATSSGKGQAAASTSAKATKAAASEMVRWTSAIRTRIERRKRSVRATGSVTLQISVARTGMLQSAKVISSSGNPAIDKAALGAVTSAGRFPKAPSSATKASYALSLVMKFS
jgi:protein TonB